ncbi:calcium binding EGF domain protein [Cooperia oncophora]
MCRYGNFSLTLNECETENRCPKPHEECINTPGAYKCSCVHGYKREGGKCVVDVEGEQPHILYYIKWTFCIYWKNAVYTENLLN